MSCVVEYARTWIGTPYVHQASVQGVGCDCLGLVRGVWRHLYGAEPFKVPSYSADWAEPQGDEILWSTASDLMKEKPLTQWAAGDLLLFRMRGSSVAKHLGLQSTQTHFVHAYAGHGVVESALAEAWSRRIVARFEFPTEV